MSFEPFPQRIDSHKLFARNGSINSEIPVARLQRLQACLADPSGSVTVHLEFGHDDYDRRLISGTLSARLMLQCQRCLGDMALDLQTPMEVRVAASEDDAKAMPEDLESVVQDESGIDLLAVVEDELILSLPTVPQHEDLACNAELNRLRPGQASGQDNEETPAGNNAFAKLKELKELKSDDSSNDR